MRQLRQCLQYLAGWLEAEGIPPATRYCIFGAGAPPFHRAPSQTAILVNPGEVPDDDPHWQYHPADGTSPREPTFLLEKKQTGERRHCKWCGKYKPDRCHHCRVCKTCVLKMDHHCPWIYNCVGFWNYKYFFLLLFYSAVDCHIIAWTMAETVTAVVADDAEFLTAFLVLFAEMLAASLGILLVLFFIFHIVLIVRAMTTIEVYEKTLPKKKGSDSRPYHHPIYDRGCCGNFSTVLGANPLLWLLPIGGPMGDGLYFAIEGLAFDSGAGVGQMPSQNTPLKPASGSAGWGPFSSGSGAGARFSHGYGGASSGSYGGGAFNGTMAPTY